MFGQRPRELPQHLAFLLVPHFSLIAFTAAVEPLRLANRASGKELYRWHLFSGDGRPVTASNGITLHPEGALEQATGFGTVILCSGIDGHLYEDRQVFAQLRRLERAGADIGALCTGSHILAKAGLLDGYRCTIHWEELENFAREFPHLEVTADLIEADRDRLTCPGGTASLDLIFHIVQQQHGRDLAWQIADEFIQHRVRSPNDPQRLSLEARTRINDARLLAAVAAMEKNLEDPLSLEQICTASGLSLRHLQRRFLEVLGKPPTEFYRELRLQRARKMLMHGSRSILDVAVANGFVSGAHFSRCYRAQFGRTPREERRG